MLFSFQYLKPKKCLSPIGVNYKKSVTRMPLCNIRKENIIVDNKSKANTTKETKYENVVHEHD